jgi:hypothetical protein
MEHTNPFDERLEAALKNLANHEHDAVAEERLASAHVAPSGVGTSATSTRRRRTVYAVLGMAAAAAAVVGLNATGVLGSSQQNSTPSATTQAPGQGSGSDEPAGLVGPGEPCPGAVHGDPNSLATEIPIWLPAGDGERKVTDAWTCADTPVVVFGDIQISYEAGWADVDVEKKWAALAADYGGDVTTVLGRPGLVQSAEQTKGTNNQVLVVVDGTLVRVLSKSDVPINELLRLADSLDVKSAQGGSSEH